MGYNLIMIEKLKEFYKFANKNLNKIRFIYNYIVLPVTFIVSFILMIISFILLFINPVKFMIAGIVLFMIVLVMSIAAFLVLPFVVRSKEINIEAQHLKELFESKLFENPLTEYVLPKVDGGGIIPLVFAKTGFTLDNKSYSYDEFECGLFTSNYLYKANLVLVFSKKSEETSETEGKKSSHKEETEKINDQGSEGKEIKSFSLPLDINMLSIVKNFDIKLKNADVLLFIKDYPQIASKQILRYGRIQNNYDKFRKNKEKDNVNDKEKE